MSSFQSQANKVKEAMEKEYKKAMEVIFAYGYGCCVFKHNFCRDHPKVPDGMDSTDPLPPMFFTNPRCPLFQAIVEAIATDVPLNEVA